MAVLEVFWGQDSGLEEMKFGGRIVTSLLTECSLKRQSREHVTELGVEKKRGELLPIY